MKSLFQANNQFDYVQGDLETVYFNYIVKHEVTEWI